ncbi:hypothetical protein AVEN_157080-1, partial [Araneus ventricosus]
EDGEIVHVLIGHWPLTIWFGQLAPKFRKPEISYFKLLSEFSEVSRSAFSTIQETVLPELLSEGNKKKRMESAVTFLTLYNEENDDFFSRIFAGDETWVTPLLQSENIPVWQPIRH